MNFLELKTKKIEFEKSKIIQDKRINLIKNTLKNNFLKLDSLE